MDYEDYIKVLNDQALSSCEAGSSAWWIDVMDEMYTAVRLASKQGESIRAAAYLAASLYILKGSRFTNPATVQASERALDTLSMSREDLLRLAAVFISSEMSPTQEEYVALLLHGE